MSASLLITKQSHTSNIHSPSEEFDIDKLPCESPKHCSSDISLGSVSGSPHKFTKSVVNHRKSPRHIYKSLHRQRNSHYICHNSQHRQHHSPRRQLSRVHNDQKTGGNISTSKNQSSTIESSSRESSPVNEPLQERKNGAAYNTNKPILSANSMYINV